MHVFAKRNVNGVKRHSVNGVSNKFKRMAALYKIFAESLSQRLDFSDDSLLELYNFESFGGSISSNNGFAFGKQYLNLQVTMWREDLIAGNLTKAELYEDDRFPHEWLDRVLKTLWYGETFHSVVEKTKLGRSKT